MLSDTGRVRRKKSGLLLRCITQPVICGELVADAGSKDGKTTVDLQLQVGELVIDVPNAYMKRNWRTNVVGELLTAEGSFKVSIDPDFTGTNYISPG